MEHRVRYGWSSFSALQEQPCMGLPMSQAWTPLTGRSIHTAGQHWAETTYIPQQWVAAYPTAVG